jgi:hypothetical protein
MSLRLEKTPTVVVIPSGMRVRTMVLMSRT